MNLLRQTIQDITETIIPEMWVEIYEKWSKQKINFKDDEVLKIIDDEVLKILIEIQKEYDKRKIKVFLDEK